MRLRLLDDLVIELNDLEYTPASPQFFALLLRLGSEPGRLVQRDELIRLLFPMASTPGAASHSMRQLVYLATQRGAKIGKARGGLSIDIEDVSSDVDDLLGADHAMAGPEVRPVQILRDYSPSIGPALCEWVEEYRSRIRLRLRTDLAAAIDRLRAQSNWRSVDARARECLSIDPLNETATLALAEAFARTGAKVQAVATLDAYRDEVDARDPSIAVPANVLRRRIERDFVQRLPAVTNPPFVGRGEESSHLYEHWKRARSGELVISLVVGEAGSGKTRLIDEYLALASYSGNSATAAIHKSFTESFRPFAFFADLIPQLMILPGAAGCDPALMPFLNRLTGASDSLHDPVRSPDDAQFVASGISRAVVDLLNALGAERTCIVIVDDSRSIDDISLSLLQSLSSLVTSPKLHVVITCYPGEETDRLSGLKATTVPLPPLIPSMARDLVTSLSPPGGFSSEALDWCLALGAGNPGFLVLLANECLAGGANRVVPTDMVSAVDRSLAALPLAARLILEGCEILGDHCDSLTLAEIAGVSAFDTLTALDVLEKGGFIIFDGAHIRVRSGLISERLRALGSKAIFTMLHSKAAAALERDMDGGAPPWRIAAHWRDSGQSTRARKFLSDSWRKSIAVGQPKVAVESIREYMAITFDPEERVSLYDELVESTQAGGNHPAVISVLDERENLLLETNIVDPNAESVAFDRLVSGCPTEIDPSQCRRALGAFMRSPTLHPSKRSWAACLLVVAADSEGDSALARSVFAELPMPSRIDSISDVNYGLAGLVYHSVFGDRVQARRILTALLSSNCNVPSNPSYHRLNFNASLAMQLIGDVGLIPQHLANLYDVHMTAGVDAKSALVAARIANIALDDGYIDSAERWAATANAHIISSNIAPPPDYLSVAADLAMIRGDASSAASLIETMERGVPAYSAKRYRMDLLAYKSRLSACGGFPYPEEFIDELLEWHVAARGLGRHDDVMEALWTGLRLTSRVQLASSLLLEYLNEHRRDERSPRHIFLTRTSADGAWGMRGTTKS